MGDKNLIDFEEAGRPHVFKRREKKVLKLKKAFEASRTEGETKKGKGRKKRRKKKK